MCIRDRGEGPDGPASVADSVRRVESPVRTEVGQASPGSGLPWGPRERARPADSLPVSSKRANPPGLPGEFQARRLERNLAALAGRNPKLVERLGWPAGESHVRFESNGATRLLWRRGWHRLDLSGAARAGTIIRQAARSGQEGILMGCGLGEIVEAVLAECTTTRWTAWERDPWLLRLMLARLDLSEAISAGRLKLALGGDLVELARDGAVEKQLRVHPVLGSIYAGEVEAVRLGSSGDVALVAEGELFVDQVRGALGRRGLVPITVDLEQLSVEELDHTVRSTRPAVLLAINYTHGLAEFCESRRLPWICWEIDPSTDDLKPLESPTRCGHVFTYARQHVQEFEAAGFTSVQHLPLASDVHSRRPWEAVADERKEFGAQVAFVGASMVQSGRELLDDLVRRAEQLGFADARQRCQALLGRQRSQPTEFGLGRWLARDWPDLEPALAELGGPSATVALGEAAAAEKRLGVLAGLAEFDTQVWGDGGWKLVESSGVRWRGGARHQADLPRIYSSADINLDVGRLYQSEIVTMRVFDVLACGGFCLTEANEEVGRLFAVGTELDVYKNPEDLARRVRWWLEHPDERKLVASSGRQAVLERHTIDQRIGHMLRVALGGIARAA